MTRYYFKGELILKGTAIIRFPFVGNQIVDTKVPMKDDVPPNATLLGPIDPVELTGAPKLHDRVTLDLSEDCRLVGEIWVVEEPEP